MNTTRFGAILGAFALSIVATAFAAPAHAEMEARATGGDSTVDMRIAGVPNGVECSMSVVRNQGKVEYKGKGKAKDDGVIEFTLTGVAPGKYLLSGATCSNGSMLPMAANNAVYVGPQRDIYRLLDNAGSSFLIPT